MAIYHLSVKPISRSAGRSGTAAAAYRSAEKIVDERTGEIHDYTRKGGVENSGIVLPAGSDWTPSRSELWNAAEQSEKRKDSCVAREHEIALPHELGQEQRLALVQSYAQDLAERHKCAVDYAIHAPSKGDGGKELNWHAHVLCTTREVSGQGLGAKCQREKSGQDRKADLERERVQWESAANQALRRAGVEQVIDRRSLKEQGIDRMPTSHLGPAVTGMVKRGASSQVVDRIQAEITDRLTAAKQLGELERQGTSLEHSVIALNTDITAAKAEQAINEKELHDNRATAFERIDAACRATVRSSGATNRAGAFVGSDVGGLAQKHRAIEVANRGISQAIAERRHSGDVGKAVGAIGQVIERTHRTLAAAAPVVLAVVEQRPAPEVKQAAASGVADFRAQFEQAKLAETGKQQARQAFEQFKAEQQAQQRQAELAKQQAEQREKTRLQEAADKQRVEREAKKQERDGPGWSR